MDIFPKKVEVPPIPSPEPMRVEAKGSAIVIVDMQRDFVEEGGRLYVGPSVRETIPKIHSLIAEGRRHRIPLIYTQDWHREGSPEFALWGQHCLEGSDGADFIEGLKPEPMDYVVRKETYDPFYGTELERILRELLIRRIVVVGTVSNICVLHTVSGASLRGIRSIVPVDCISAITTFDAILALRQFTFLYKAVLTRSDILSFQP
ncbi:cysteine hydrolase [Candidatus Bathyarchaeota archaeon]|nr:cysteine hydrolase [Candidatus Bathyarchaeota archaeon]